MTPPAPIAAPLTTRWSTSSAVPLIPYHHLQLSTHPICGRHPSRSPNSCQGSHSSPTCPHCRSILTSFLHNPHSPCWLPPSWPPAGPHHPHFTHFISPVVRWSSPPPLTINNPISNVSEILMESNVLLHVNPCDNKPSVRFSIDQIDASKAQLSPGFHDVCSSSSSTEHSTPHLGDLTQSFASPNSLYSKVRSSNFTSSSTAFGTISSQPFNVTASYTCSTSTPYAPLSYLAPLRYWVQILCPVNLFPLVYALLTTHRLPLRRSRTPFALQSLSLLTDLLVSLFLKPPVFFLRPRLLWLVRACLVQRLLSITARPFLIMFMLVLLKYSLIPPHMFLVLAFL